MKKHLWIKAGPRSKVQADILIKANLPRAFNDEQLE